MGRFAALIKKELLVLSKDIHGLVVLFIMPAVFILIMSLAMQDSFGEKSKVAIDYVIFDKSQSPLSRQFIDQLKLIKNLRLTSVSDNQYDSETLKEAFSANQYKFGVVVSADFGERLLQSDQQLEAKPVLDIYLAPTVKPDLRRFFNATIRSELIRLKIAATLASEDDEDGFAPSMEAVESMSQVRITQSYLYQTQSQRHNPTSVQQNVPAWLVFAMFFVVVPLSTAFIVERQQGSFLRLRMMNIFPGSLLGAKIVPYYVVNQIQMLLMILVGMYLVPLLGGSELGAPSSVLGLVIISSATSIAAICFALFISTFAKTTTHATTLGGISNIIFGALGGIMVPKFIMPPYMQEITVISPMSWGLEGFLDVLLRDDQWQAVIPESTFLLIFAMICLGVATLLFRRQGL